MSVTSLCILGRQPSISSAELESLYGDRCEKLISNSAMLLSLGPEHIDFQRLGGTIKLCKVIAVLDTNSWKEVERQLIESVPQEILSLPVSGKIHLGISVYGLSVKPEQITACGLKLKKLIRTGGSFSVRLTTSNSLALNSAQVIHNKLTTANGREIILVRDGSKTIYARTLEVQDIASYSRRDYDRPKRDARVGMLPPKLAQIMINLATGETSTSKAHRDAYGVDHLDQVVLDPFCGTGVILQESLLMGYGVYGSDINQRIIDYSNINVSDWLLRNYPAITAPINLEIGDATKHTWQKPFDYVASELFLGKPLMSFPPSNDLKNLIETCNTIACEFLKNIGTQVSAGFRLCLALPVWRSSNGKFYRLPILDHLDDMGYNRLSFKYASNSDLIYIRPQQIVGRELLTIKRR